MKAKVTQNSPKIHFLVFSRVFFSKKYRFSARPLFDRGNIFIICFEIFDHFSLIFYFHIYIWFTGKATKRSCRVCKDSPREVRNRIHRPQNPFHSESTVVVKSTNWSSTHSQHICGLNYYIFYSHLLFVSLHYNRCGLRYFFMFCSMVYRLPISSVILAVPVFSTATAHYLVAYGSFYTLTIMWLYFQSVLQMHRLLRSLGGACVCVHLHLHACLLAPVIR